MRARASQPTADITRNMLEDKYERSFRQCMVLCGQNDSYLAIADLLTEITATHQQLIKFLTVDRHRAYTLAKIKVNQLSPMTIWPELKIKKNWVKNFKTENLF